MPTDLYTDALAWSGQQSALLRRLAAGERVNDAIDWPNVIEEIEDVGQSELRAAKSLLRNAMLHLLKCHAWPDGPVAHWLDEADTFLTDAALAFSPSMRGKLDVGELYRVAKTKIVRLQIDAKPPRALPETCPFLLDDLITQNELPPDVRTLLTKLTAPPPT